MPGPAGIAGSQGVAVMVGVGFFASAAISAGFMVDPRRTVYRVALWGGAALFLTGKAFVVVSNFHQLTVWS